MAGRDETVFQPFPRKEGSEPAQSDRTQFMPLPSPGAAPAQPQHAPAPAATPSVSAIGIRPGSVLNHMFEVKRFLARGGMGEVFDGVNISNGERVAIKVILPALAADPNIIAMFRKEAQALTRLSHRALVRYRVQAQEPNLGCYYIVTSFIDGMSLSDAVGRLQPTLEELVDLMRLLAEGLGEAHAAGVVHRDISPDNILLENRQLDRARVIDFGIAKDTSAEARTIIGNRFAGKLRYAAPEQLGDFGHEIGPWTDVYSLALVILGLAQGSAPDTAGMPVEALRKRRQGIDTSGAPEALRPVLDEMLAADPKVRLRSMDEVIAALAKVGKGRAKAGALWPPSRAVLIGGSAVAAIALLATVGALVLGRGGGEEPAPAPTASAAPAVPVASLQALDARIAAVLPSLACSWVAVTTANGPSGVTLTGSGVAGRPEDVEARLFDALRAAGANVASSDFSAVSPIDVTFCPMLGELGKIRNTGETHMTSAQSRYELGVMEEGAYAGQKGTHVVVDLSLAGIDGDFALYAVEKSNQISEIFPSRAAFLAATQETQAIEKLPGADHYRLTLDGTPQPGWSGILLVTGKGGFSDKLISDLGGGKGQAAFEKAAKTNGWKTEMVWYKFVDEIPDVLPPPSSEAPVPTASATATSAAKR